MEEQVSKRLAEQRIRNRVIEVLETLSLGPDGVRAVGVAEYFESFYDWVSDDRPWNWRTYTTFTSAEVDAIDQVLAALDQACAQTQGVDDGTGFIATGWPDRLRPLALEAVKLMIARGRFNEEREETEPSRL